jgi:hypothetical protein
MLEARVARFEVRLAEGDEAALKRTEAPVLRWSNPVRDFVNDGLTFVWLEGTRPRAMVTCWARSTKAELNEGEVCREFVSLSDTRLELRQGERTLWEPKSGGVVDQELAGAGEPQANATRRLAQMRDLARRFQASSHKSNTSSELRLLPQPLYRYSDKTAGIVDGALFAFVEGNDPEVFLVLEGSAKEDRKRSAWRYSLARSASHRISVRLDDREVFAVDPYWSTGRSLNDVYVEGSEGPFTLDDGAGSTTLPTARKATVAP